MFEGYEKFENVYIVDPKCSIDPVMTNMHNIDIDYKNVLRQMNSYNTNIGNKINNMIKDLHEY